MGRLARSTRLSSILRQLPCPRRALDLGCGGDDDLAAYLTNHCTAETEQHEVVIVSIDLDLPGLQSIRRRAKSRPVQADLNALPLGSLTPFDLVLIRHPDIDRAHKTWQSIFFRASTLVSMDGILLITAYSAAEIEQINRWLTIPTLRIHPLALDQTSPPDLVGRDRFIAAYSRKR